MWVQHLLTCGIEGNSSHGNVIDYDNNNDKFILNHDDFFTLHCLLSLNLLCIFY